MVVVATALCADRAADAAHAAPRPQQRTAASLAGRIVERLSIGFRGSVRMDLPVQPRSGAPDAMTRLPVAEARPADVAHRLVSPFQFRLPPPPLA